MASFYIQLESAKHGSECCARVWYKVGEVEVSHIELVHRRDASSFSKRSEAMREIERFPSEFLGPWVVNVR